MTNPFKPSAGSSPPLLIGRAEQLQAVAEALREGPGSPGRLTIFTGARGVGKTVMLNEVAEIAQREGWFVINETATAGLLARLDSAVEHLADSVSPRKRRRVTGIQVPPGVGVSTELTPELSVTLRRRISDFLDLPGQRVPGLLVTLDEVQGAERSELRELGAIAQHMVREDREFALVMAGLPSSISLLLSDKVTTFLRRADRHHLGDVSLEEVQDALESTFADQGRQLSRSASSAAAEATGGYPFLVQLVGYHVWRSTTELTIDLRHARAGIDAARRKLGTLVHETALGDLSDIDRKFLAAMSLDDGPSQMRDIIRRMQVAPQYANVYRNRLLDAEVIERAGHGKVTFALPYLREYLRERAVSLGIHVSPSG